MIIYRIDINIQHSKCDHKNKRKKKSEKKFLEIFTPEKERYHRLNFTKVRAPKLPKHIEEFGFTYYTPIICQHNGSVNLCQSYCI
jgi:hypothetical protein